MYMLGGLCLWLRAGLVNYADEFEIGKMMDGWLMEGWLMEEYIEEWCMDEGIDEWMEFENLTPCCRKWSSVKVRWSLDIYQKKKNNDKNNEFQISCAFIWLGQQ